MQVPSQPWGDVKFSGLFGEPLVFFWEKEVRGDQRWRSDGQKGIFKGAQMRQLAGSVLGFEGNSGRRGAMSL